MSVEGEGLGEGRVYEMNAEEIQEVLKAHAAWLKGDRGGNRANLRDADLMDAGLRSADLRSANLRGADLRGAKLSHFQIPQEGELVVYKKTREGVVKLRVPPEAKRTASLVGRKCRAEYVETLEGSGRTSWGGSTAYITGKITRPDKYDPDIRVECTHGIHFFLTREEAEEW